LIDDDIKDSFIHVTSATDTNNMEFVLESTRSIIMTAVSDIGLVLQQFEVSG